LSNWNTSSVTNMGGMFWGACFTNVSALSNWNTSSVTNMSQIFSSASNLTDISALANWNTSSVTNMSGMFNSNYNLTDISALANWNTSSVTNMSDMFSSTPSLTNISALSNWNTSSVTNMDSMFRGASSLTDISALANWNTSSVTDMRSMFSDTDIADGSAISNWDIRAVTATNGSIAYNSNKFYRMFYKSDNGYPIYPNFTKRIGAWNADGTFVPASVTARTVTVNLDEHVRSVKFYDSTYGTRTITKDGDFIILNRGTQYTITATYDAGYIIDSWSSTAGTVGSSTVSPTTYRTYSDDTLSITSTVASTSTVTVNMDSHVSSVSFNNQGYGTETVTTNNGTVTLVNNLTYYVVINYESGYMNSSLAATANGTIGNATTNGISYTIVGDDTISITSQQKTGTAALVTGSVLYSAINNKVKAIRMAGFLPTNFSPSSSNTISVSDSEKPVYIFFDTTNDANILYIYTEARDIYMNENSDSAFSGNRYLTDISALAEFNTSNVTSMVRMFSGASSLTNISVLVNWDTSSVTDMSDMFTYASYLTDISGLSNWNTGSVTNMDSMFSHNSRLTNLSALSNWNTSNVTSMSYMFWLDSRLTDISGLSNWNTSSVENMEEMFSYTAITNTNALSNWNTGNVTNMDSMFADNYSLTNISGLSNWNTDSVEDMGYMFSSTGITNTNALANWNTGNVIYMDGMFAYINNLTDISGLSNWNTSSVTSMGHMFWNSDLANISALANWDTSSVTDMNGMFFGTDIADGSAISGWDVRAVTAANGDATSSNRFYQMFHIHSYYHDTVIYPNFTKRLGTWNDEGTFIPSSTTTRIVTVNLDEHVNSVSFYNSDYGTKTIAKDGDFIALASGATYTITATVDDGYAFDGWHAIYGSLRNPTANPTTYSTASDDYITAYSRTVTNSYQPSQHGTEPSNSGSVLAQSASAAANNVISSSISNSPKSSYATPQGVSNTVVSDDTDLSSVIILASAVGATASGALVIFFAKHRKDDYGDED
jgi:surface protein